MNTSGHSVEGTKRRSSLTVEVLSQSEYSRKRLAATGTLQDNTDTSFSSLTGSSTLPMADERRVDFDQAATAFCEDKGFSH